MNLFKLVPPQTESDPQADAWRFLSYLHSPAVDPYPLPVDPGAIATEIGLVTIDSDLPTTFLGYLHWDELGPTIVVNRQQSYTQKRLIQARELGRFVDIMQTGKRTEYQNNCYNNDLYAHRFAAELLMPRIALSQLNLKLPQLADAFAVDPATLEYRLQKFS